MYIKQEHHMWCQRSAAAAFFKKILSRKRGITTSKTILELPALLVWFPLLTVDNWSEFQVNIFSNN